MPAGLGPIGILRTYQPASIHPIMKKDADIPTGKERTLSPDNHRLQTVLFDLDGTLLHSEQVNLRVVRRMCQEALGREPLQDELSRFRTLSTSALLAEIAPDASDELLSLWPQFFHKYQHLLELYPGIPDLLGWIKDQGIRTCVVTLQNRAEIAATRDLVDLDPWIDAWVAVDDVPRPKPHPDQVLEALRLLDADPKGAVMIGDSVTDLIAARRAGVRTGAALWGSFQPESLLEQQPDFVFHSPGDVKTLQWTPV